jgi:type II secretory pathway component GspD/PulD (secretin)
MKSHLFSLLCAASLMITLCGGLSAAQRRPQHTPLTPIVLTFTAVRAQDAARVLRRLYPHLVFTIDGGANAIVVSAGPDDTVALRQIGAAIDTKNPLRPVTTSLILHRIDAIQIAPRLHALYPNAKLAIINKHTLLLSAVSSDLQQIQALVAAIDQPPQAATPRPAASAPDTQAVSVLQGNPRTIAREVAGAVHGIRVGVAGHSIVLAGAPDLVARAKDVISVLDTPSVGSRYTAVYRLRTLDAQSVGDLIARSYPNAKVNVDGRINSLSVSAIPAEQRRIAEGIAQLDALPSPGPGAAAGGGSSNAEIYTLKAAVPATNGSSSSTANDIATMVMQALSSQAPDLHITVSPTSPKLILTGNPYSIKLAEDLIAKLDVSEKLVVLDTEILEVDQNTAKNLGISLSSIFGGDFSIGTLIGESTPAPDPVTGITPGLMRPQKLIRTPIAFGFQLNLAIQHGSARVLADPRITTLSGHTATIRAGDNLSIALQAGGGPGTIATTQIQTFQTGVTLDITPIVNDDGLITVALHPVVNSLTGILNGIPQISTRDTQTTVALRENQTLIIGGLIQDNTQRTESKIPVLGDIPLLGHLFRNETLNGVSNELIITVTPHVVTPGAPEGIYPVPLQSVPTPGPLPTLSPGAVLPTPQFSLRLPVPTMRPLPNVPPPFRPLSRRAPARIAGLLTPTPSPMPSVFAQANVFTFGSPPPNNFAAPGDSVKIFYASFSPTIVSYGTPVTVTAITTSNVNAVTLSYNGVQTSIAQSGAGQWSATIPFTLVGLPEPNSTIQLSLTASKSDGTSSVIPISVSVVARTSTAAGSQDEYNLRK